MTRALVVCFTLVGIASRDPGCSGVSSDHGSVVGAPCTRTKDCYGDAVCVGGVCIDADAAADGAAAPDGGSPGDGGDGGD